MKTFSLTMAIFTASIVLTGPVVAQSMATLALPLTPSEQADRLGEMTKAEKSAWVRDTISEGPYRGRGLETIFKNFEGANYIDPAIPGVANAVKTAALYHFPNRKGATRTLIYATAVYNDPRFELLGIDQNIYLPNGIKDTDKDLVIRDRKNGNRIRIESKAATKTSQSGDAERIQGQIAKMVNELKKTGELQVYVSSHETPQSIKDYARQNGVAVYDDTHQKDFRDKVLNEIKTASDLKTRSSLVGGAGEVGIGIWMLAQSTPETLVDLENVLNSDTRNKQEMLRLGEHGAFSLSAISVSAAGASRLISYSSLVSNVRTLNSLGAVGKWGGRAGVAFFLISEGFVIADWQSGGLDDRQFYTIQGGLGGGLIGGAGGTVVFAWIGGGIGAFFGPEGIPIGAGIGGLIGGLGGGFGGSSLGAGAVDRIYQSKDEAQKTEIQNFIYQYYGVGR